MRISHVTFMNWIVVAVAGLVAAVGVAQAQLVNADVGINPTYEQTGPTTITSTGGFFSARAFVTSFGRLYGRHADLRGHGVAGDPFL